MDILTKGNVIVNKIEVGDIHWEHMYKCCIKVVVVEAPERYLITNGTTSVPSPAQYRWIWKSQILDKHDKLIDGAVITYGTDESCNHHAPDLNDRSGYLIRLYPDAYAAADETLRIQ